MKRNLSCLFILLLLSVSAFAQCDPRSVVAINGILTSSEGAANNAFLLQDSYRAAHSTAVSRPAFLFLYNPSGQTIGKVGGVVIDLVESALQLTGLNISRLIRMFGAVEIIPPEASSTLTTLMSNAVVVAFNPDHATLLSMSDRLVVDIKAGRTVLLVGHSQGNLWANSLLALSYMRGNSGIAQIGVGVPDSHLERSISRNITLSDDKVIGLLPFAMPATASNGYTLKQLLGKAMGHSFTSAYLDAGSDSEMKVIAAMDESMSVLTSGNPVANTCQDIEVTDFSCQLVPDWPTKEFPFDLVFKGIARSTIPGTWLVAGSATSGFFDPVPVGYGTCEGWPSPYLSAPPIYSMARTCISAVGDPTTTKWEVRALSKWNRSLGASLHTTEGVNSMTRAFDELNVACPGIFHCSGGRCLPVP